MSGLAPRDVEAGNGSGGIVRVTSGEETEAKRSGNLAYQEINNLVEFEEHPLLSAALREWDRKESYFGNRVDRREKASADLVNQIFNIVGFFSVFQGVVLTAVTQLKSDSFDTCGLIWWPAVLSAVAGVVTIAGVSLKFQTLQELESSIYNEKFLQKEAVKRATKLRADGTQFSFSRIAKDSCVQSEKLKKFHITWFCVVLLLFVFTVLFVLSYFAILCDVLLVRAWKGGLHP